jgi:hypothetical protein
MRQLKLTFKSGPGLPDCIFSNQKSPFGQILEGLAKEDVGIFFGHLVYFIDIWYLLWTFGIFYGHLVYFMDIWYIIPHFGMLYQEKSGNPGVGGGWGTPSDYKAVLRFCRKS